MAGKRGRCAGCEAVFIVPEPKKQAPSAAAPATKPAQPSKPTKPINDATHEIGLECRVCGTRMYGRLDQVGKRLKCPDCGARTEVPPPPEPKKPNMPAALEGEQYELWDVDAQPLPSELIKAEKKYITFKCSHCGTLLNATMKQIGQKITCPDCLTKHVVPPPPKKVVMPDVLAPDRLTPTLDPAAIPGARPMIIPSTYRMLHEDRLEAEYARALEKSKRTGKPMEIDARGRPILPGWPLVTGVLPFLFSAGIPIYWLSLSAGFMAAGWVLLMGLQMAMSGGIGAIAGMCFFALGCVLTMICASAGSSLFVQVVAESSTGCRQIDNWPSFFDWYGSAFYMFIGGMLSALPGWAIAHVPPLASSSGTAEPLTVVSIGVCFPVILLSQLDNVSPMGLLSGRVLASMARCPFSWMFFYFESALLVALCGLITFLVDTGGQVARVVSFRGEAINFVGSPLTVLWMTPLYVAALIIWARLLGRLAWRVAETAPIEEPPAEEEVQPRGPKNYNPPRQPRAST